MTTPPSADTPTRRFFQIFELLEAVLSLLPMQDLLLSQRTSSHFRDTVTKSPQLQRQLFFQPQPPGSQFTFNPLLCMLGDWTEAPIGYCLGMPLLAPDFEASPDFIFKHHGDLYEPGRMGYRRMDRTIVWEYKVRQVQEVHHSRIKDVEANSMGGMFVTQPPTSIFLLGFETNFNPAVRVEVQGARLGEMLAELKRHRLEWDNEMIGDYTRRQRVLLRRRPLKKYFP